MLKAYIEVLKSVVNDQIYVIYVSIQSQISVQLYNKEKMTVMSHEHYSDAFSCINSVILRSDCGWHCFYSDQPTAPPSFSSSLSICL